MEIVFFSVYIILAFGLAIGAMAYLGIALTSISSRVDKFEKWLPVVLVLMAGLLMCASGLLNSRNLQYASLGAGFINSEPSSIFLWVSRLTSLALVAITIPYFIVKALKSLSYQSRISWPLVTIVCFGLGSFLLPGFLGAVPYFDHRSLYPVIVMIAVYLAAEKNVNGTLIAVKWSILIFLIVSLAFIALDSSRVMAPGYRGWIPGLSSRFWGLAPHANAIGPMAALTIFLEILCPSRYKPVRLAVFACASAVLILAQSKTAIGASVIGLIVILYARIGNRNSSAPRTGLYLHGGHLFLLVSAIVATAAILLLANLGLLDKLFSRLDSMGITSSVQSISGRTVIWEAALREYSNNPLFGYGPTLWDDAYRRAIGLSYAFHAHNQILQTMAESGTIGLIALLAFLFLALSRAFQTYQITKGVSIAILVLIGFRVMTEVPLNPVGIGNGEMLSIVAMICIWHLARKSQHTIKKSDTRMPCPLQNSQS